MAAVPGSADDSREEDESLAELLGQVAHAPVYQAEWTGSGAPRLSRSDGEASIPLPAVGSVLDDKYRVDAVLGEGGMGVVYAATQLNTGRVVALKWMHPDRLGRTSAERERACARFVREARVAAHIDHPNRVEIYDVGGDPDRPYLVMERLQGESLRARLDRTGPLEWDAALALLSPVFDVLEAAHAAGIVHRDLKPDNLFLTRHHDGREVAKVLDFGISRLNDGEQDDEPTLTRTGSVLGTPAYMPLEQLRGERELDARADVYALGVVLYEMLTGARPYQARNAADYAAVLASGHPTPLSDHRPALRGARERALMRALSRDRSQRPESVAQLRRSLVQARGRSRKRRRAIACVAGVAAAIFIGAYIWKTPELAFRAQPDGASVAETASSGALPVSTQAESSLAGPKQPRSAEPSVPQSTALEIRSPASAHRDPEGDGAPDAAATSEQPPDLPRPRGARRKRARSQPPTRSDSRPVASGSKATPVDATASVPALQAWQFGQGEPEAGARAQSPPAKAPTLRREDF